MTSTVTGKLVALYLLFLHLFAAFAVTQALLVSSRPLGDRIADVVANPAKLLRRHTQDGGYSPPTYHYKAMVAFHLRGDSLLLPGQIFFLGDSLTQGLPVSSVIQNAVNYGIGTDDTGGLIKRIQQYESLHSARALVIAIGVNDLLIRDDDELMANYNQLLDSLPDGPIVMCALMLPIQESIRTEWHGRSSMRIRAVNARMAESCRERSYEVIDATDILSDDNGELQSHLHEGDGLHLSQAGYAAWIPVLKAALQKALNQPPPGD